MTVSDTPKASCRSGNSTGDGYSVELVDHVEQEQHHEHAGPAGPDALAERHGGFAHAGQQIVGQHHHFRLGLLLSEALGLLLEDGRGQAGWIV